MATDFVPKQQLVDRIRQIKEKRESGVLSITTESGRSVILRFLEGRVTHSNAKGKGLQESMQVLAQSPTLQFSFAATADGFADLFEVGSASGGGGSAAPTQQNFDEDRVRKVLTELIVAHIGPMAAIVVDQAIANANTVERVVNAVAREIPNGIEAESFREKALEKLRKS